MRHTTADTSGAQAHASLASSVYRGTGGVIRILGRPYAVGLVWHVSPSENVRQEALEAARESRIPIHFFSIRPGLKNGKRIAQYGLAIKASGYRIRIPAAAASLAIERPGSWATAIKFPQGVWVCVCRDDLITPDGDVLYKNEDQARTRMIAEIEMGGLHEVHAPKNWNLPKTMSIPLHKLFKGEVQGHLCAVKDKRLKIGALVAAGALTIGILGYVLAPYLYAITLIR